MFIRSALAAIALSLITGTAPASAQVVQTEPDPRCFYASMSFSPGAEVAIGELRYLCAVEDGIGMWKTNDDPALKPSCVFDGKLYGEGAKAGTADAKVECESDGTWKPA